MPKNFVCLWERLLQTRNKIIPYFTIHNAHEFIDFMAITFGAKVVTLARHNDGTVQHARLVIDDSIMMLNEASETYPANSSQMHMYVNSVQETYEIAIQKRCLSLMQPMMRPHGDLMAGFKDPFGNTWWIAELSPQTLIK